jgi:hypothetical protein
MVEIVKGVSYNKRKNYTTDVRLQVENPEKNL